MAPRVRKNGMPSPNISSSSSSLPDAPDATALPPHHAAAPARRRGRRLLGALLGIGTVLAGLAACAPTATLNALAALEGQDRTVDVAYGALPRQRLDIYRPRAAAAPASGWPVVVFFYGGSWVRGARADYRFVGEALASRGILTLVADYRLHPEVRYPRFPARQRPGPGLRLAAGGCLGRRPETRLRDGPQRRRLQRRHAGPRRALAGPAGPRPRRAGRLHRPGRPLRFPADRQPGRAAGVLPPPLPGRQPAAGARRGGCAAHLPGRAGRRRVGQPGAQHRRAGRAPGRARGARDAQALRTAPTTSRSSAPSADRCAAWRPCWTMWRPSCVGRRSPRTRCAAAQVLAAASLSCVRVSKSLASWRSWSWLARSPRVRLTMRPRATPGRASSCSAQRRTWV